MFKLPFWLPHFPKPGSFFIYGETDKFFSFTVEASKYQGQGFWNFLKLKSQMCSTCLTFHSTLPFDFWSKACSTPERKEIQANSPPQRDNIAKCYLIYVYL